MAGSGNVALIIAPGIRKYYGKKMGFRVVASFSLHTTIQSRAAFSPGIASVDPQHEWTYPDFTFTESRREATQALRLYPMTRKFPTQGCHGRLTSPTLIAFAALVAVICAPLQAQQATADTATHYADLREQLSRYEQELEALEGSYNQSSTELYLTLGALYHELGEVDDSIAAYREALQSLRISEGLASESQLQVIGDFNGLLFEAEIWEELDMNFHLASDIALRLYGPDDPRYQRAANALASWKIRAYQTGLYRPRGNRSIQEAATIYRRLAEQLSPEEDGYNRKLAGYLSARGLAHFYSANHVAGIPVEEFRATPMHNSFQSCMPVVLSVDQGASPSSGACNVNPISDPEIFASQQREKNNTVRRHLGNMRQSFLEAIDAVEADPNASTRELAVAILNYADANLLAQDYSRARLQYKRAYELLSDNPDLTPLRDELMDRPSKALSGIVGELPFDSLLPVNVALGTIAFDVNEMGDIENINIEGASEALSRENMAAIAMMLQQSSYRPRIVDGRPVKSRVTLSTLEL